MLKATFESKTLVTSGNELTDTSQSSVKSYLVLLLLHPSSLRAHVELLLQHKLSFIWPTPMKVPGAPKEPPSYHHPPPFPRTPIPTIFYLDKLLIQLMQLGCNSCTSGLFLSNRSLGHNRLLDKHCTLAGWTVIRFCKSFKKKITDKKTTMNVKSFSSNSLPNGWHNIQEIGKKAWAAGREKVSCSPTIPLLVCKQITFASRCIGREDQTSKQTLYVKQTVF